MMMSALADPFHPVYQKKYSDEVINSVHKGNQKIEGEKNSLFVLLRAVEQDSVAYFQ